MFEIIQISLLIIAFFFSAFFSGIETALISARRIQIEVWRKRKRPGAQRAYRTLQNPETYLVTTLVGNNIAVVAASSLMAFYLRPYMNGFLITLISTIILLMIGEIIPKSFARDKASSTLLWGSFLLQAIYFLLYPFIKCITLFSKMLLWFVGIPQHDIQRFFSRKDMDMLVHESEADGIMGKSERRIISRMLLKGTYKVRDIMIPRTEIYALEKTCTLQKTISTFRKKGISRMTVFDETLDEILGIVHAKDLIIKHPESLEEILRPVHFVPESQFIGECLQELKSKNMRLAIVVDEYGGTAGLVTMEDILEEFLGDILDEYDIETKWYRNIGQNKIEVHARVEIGELNEKLNLQIPPGDYQTLGGYLLNKLENIPKIGEKIKLRVAEITILSATRKRINWVEIKFHESRKINIKD